MEIFTKLIERIIKEQENIIGPIAIEQAEKVTGLRIDWKKKKIVLLSGGKEVIEKLVERYRDLFGQVSVEFCRQAVKDLIKEIPKDQIPPILR